METGKAAEFFRSDGVVVSGAATGEITDVSEVKGQYTKVKGQKHVEASEFKMTCVFKVIN